MPVLIKSLYILIKRQSQDPLVVHEHDDWVFTLLRDMCLPPNLVTTSAHYLSDVKKKRDNPRLNCMFKTNCLCSKYTIPGKEALMDPTGGRFCHPLQSDVIRE